MKSEAKLQICTSQVALLIIVAVPSRHKIRRNETLEFPFVLVNRIEQRIGRYSREAFERNKIGLATGPRLLKQGSAL